MHTLPELTYSYKALEPYIDARTMEVHYTKHHAGYVNKLNKALEDSGSKELANADLDALLRNLNECPMEQRTTIRNNGGGHYNHTLFWSIMGPGKGGQPNGDLASAIQRTFGSFDNFKEQFENAATTQFGSGWAWLYYQNGNLKVDNTPNQDNPLITGQGTPILGLDVWEHAYYLKYQNRRAEYVGNFWNCVDWDAVAKRYDALRA